jgi:hypothetical protein
MDDTTLGLIELVKQRETIPDSGAAYSDDVLLNFLDQALKGFIVPAIEATLEEHFVVTMDTQMPVIPTYPAGSPPTNVKNWVMVPGESSGLRLRDVYIVGTDGSFYNVPRLTPTQAAALSFGNALVVLPQMNNQYVGGFYLQGNQLQIFPYGLASGKIVRITYQRPPADLCLTTDAGMVVSITGDVCTLDKVLPWYAGFTRVCAISGDLPHDYVQDASVATTVYTSYAPIHNATLVNCVSNIITLPAGTGANIVAGDWICPRGTSVFAQNIPKDLLPVLVQKAATMVLESAGDRTGQKTAEDTYNSMIKMALLMIAPRVVGKPIKLIPTNSAFRASKGSSWGRW